MCCSMHDETFTADNFSWNEMNDKEVHGDEEEQIRNKKTKMKRRNATRPEDLLSMQTIKQATIWARPHVQNEFF